MSRTASRPNAPLRRAALTALATGLMLVAVLVAPRSATAATVTGGALNAPGEQSHNVAAGWPEVFYVWEGLVREKVALGPRVGVQIWPLAVSVGMHARFSLVEKGRVALALLVAPSFNAAGYGGTRATYRQTFGRVRVFRPSIGPGVNVGVLGTIDISPVTHILVSIENPLAFWIWADDGSFWMEWPVTITGGIEYEVGFAASIFGRIGGGPAIAFAGPSLLLGGHWHAHFGVQLRY